MWKRNKSKNNSTEGSKDINAKIAYTIIREGYEDIQIQ